MALSGYSAPTVLDAWTNHVAAGKVHSLDKVLLDYDEHSLIKFCNTAEGGKAYEFRGLVEIRKYYAGLWAEFPDGAQSPVLDVDEAAKVVFVVWEPSGSSSSSLAARSATGTFIFGYDNKIRRQNVVGRRSMMAQPAAADPAAKKTTKTAANKSTKKKSKGCC